MRPPRNAATTLTAAILSVGLATGVAACGSTGTNGVATKSVPQILTTAKDAVAGADSVHVTGDLGSGATHTTLDMWLVKGKGASGHVSLLGQTLELTRIGQDVYLKGDAAFYSSLSAASPTPGARGPSTTPSAAATGATAAAPTAGGSATSASGLANSRAVQAMQGKYLHVGPNDPSYSLFASLTDSGPLVDQILTGIGALSKDGQKKVNGTNTLVLSGATPATHVYVEIDGPAYLMRVTPAGGGTLDFTEYGKTVTLVPPAKSSLVEISQLPAK